MTKVQSVCTALALAAAACSPAPEPTQPAAAGSSVPEDIAAAAAAAAPGLTITGGDLGNNQYEVSGMLPNGDEIEIDLVQSNGAWTVLELQRDVPWSSVPEPVRAAAAAAPGSFEPVRVIESTQAEDGSLVYELFQAGASSGGPAMEVRWHEGRAELLP